MIGVFVRIITLSFGSLDVKAEDGNVEHTNFHISNSMVFKANVTENIEEDQILQKSEAYVESDETKVEWKNN